MKELRWDKLLSVGIEEIDDDHRRLLELFNLLNHSVEKGEAPEYIEAILDELINCTVWHFSHEERLMLKYGYAELQEHKREHLELIESVQQLRQKILQSASAVTEADLEYLERWLTGHILSTDMKLGSYLIETM